ncbi:MAG: sulfite exporter TauE/SafE family protein [Xanthobacteraceae bacterium]
MLAGFIKGVIGLGLPTVAMGLLALFMPTVAAATILVLPSFLTNVWQMMAGRSLPPLIRRLWPMLLCSCLGTWAGAGLMTGSYASRMTVLLGATLVLYAMIGLSALRLSVTGAWAAALGPVVGIVTGAITAATGVFVMPAVPYLQAIGLDRDELVQALGLSFTVSTIALAFNLFLDATLPSTVTGGVVEATAAAFFGMWLGQNARARIDPLAFRRLFFAGLLLLGCYLAARALA